MLNWITSAYNAVFGRIDNTIASWVRALVSGLLTYVREVFSPVSHWWGELEKTVYGWIHNATDFGISVVAHIKDIYDWINHEGYLVWYYITHPTLLAQLVVDGVVAEVEADAVNMAEKLGKFLLSMIMRHLPDILKIVEDVLDAVL